MLKYFLLWLPMIVIAIANGAARDLGYKKFVGELPARQISTFTLIGFFAVYIWFALKKYPPNSSVHSLKIGALWLALTLIFEFGLGLARGNSWRVLLYDYNVFEGRIWILVLIWVALAPYLFFRQHLR